MRISFWLNKFYTVGIVKLLFITALNHPGFSVQEEIYKIITYVLSIAVLSLVLTVIYEDDDCEQVKVGRTFKKELNGLIECNRLRKDVYVITC